MPVDVGPAEVVLLVDELLLDVEVDLDVVVGGGVTAVPVPVDIY